MPDVFISYTTADSAFAKSVCEYLIKQGPEVFMAEVSLQPGQEWSTTIWSNLRASDWVLLLASKKACASPFVQQEFGIALGASAGALNKTIVPVVWDMDPAKLPGWMSRFQAIDLRSDLSGISKSLDRIATTIHAKKQQSALVIAALVAGLFILAASEG